MAQTQLEVKKPNAILFDIVGTVAKTSFIDKVLLQFVKDNIKVFFEENWDSKVVQTDLDNLRALAKEQPNGPQIPSEGERGALIAATAAFVASLGEKDKDQNSDAMTLLRFHIWFDGLKRCRIETPVYSDVVVKLKKWHAEKIRLFVCSNGWDEATKRFLARTNHGDLSALIEGFFDTEIGQFTDATTYGKVIEKIKEPAERVLLLTKDASEAKAALATGMSAILVLTHRRSIEKLDEEAKKIPRVRSFNDLAFV